ncbi:MAG: N-6 DNA methylase [Planctomycetaceae bacterium]|jgi:hypothetical protein|nr:N-6 DNA methylase [Planctomycetaceae bacterium]
MTTKEIANQKIAELVERFSKQYESYKNSDYNETQTRRDFIDPFFKALGWDVDNENGYAESYREVIHEEKVKVGKATKAPDYSFRLVGGKRLFFVEAKKPSVVIKDEIQPAYQVRRYGWSAKLPISIITDFEEFAIYDCTQKPNPYDSASKARIKYLTFQDYLKEFDFLWNTFSKENVLKGSFDKYVPSDTYKKGTSTVDKEFLQSLDNWRTYLATSICRTNKQLNEDEINFVVQQTIDRIIFLRIAEDRGVESQDSLKNAIQQGDFYKNIFRLFERADEKYNSGLFDFEKDRISETLLIDNKVLKTIVNELYYPSPYDFSVMPVEILGSAYEQFLGKVIHITTGHIAKVREKPEVRKAGGVFYTPQYVVDYIVQNTIGKLVQNKTPIGVCKIKIVDPACGSGSFLLGAYQYLLDWHRDYYSKNGKQSKGGKNDTLTPEGNLTTAEKKRILLNNIFGVDIDVNAVEVTKLSLLLKCMEGETEASIETQLRLFHEKVLPPLENNIKVGNSLIDTDYYDEQPDFKDEKKIKPFSWNRAFHDVFQNDGFDAVIGNPPWVSLNGKFGNDILNRQAQQYLIEKYHGNTYMPNLYEYFVHKGLALINKNGYFSFIVPDRLGFNNQFIALREKILRQFKIEELLYKVPFPGVIADTLIFRFVHRKSSVENFKIVVGEFNKKTQIKTPQEYLGDVEYRFTYESSDKVAKILNKIFINKKCKSLGLVAETTSGIGCVSSEITDKRKNQKQIEIIRGRSIQRFSPITPFFFEFKKENITGRTVDRNKLGVKEKVLLRKTGNFIVATYDKTGVYPEQSLYFIFNNRTNNSLKYLTALFNSKLFQFVYSNKLVTNKNSTPQLKKIDLEKFPIYVCDKADKKIHDTIVRLVEQLLQLNVKKINTRFTMNINQIEEKIAYCEDKINEIVYQLYGLTEKEIKAVEGK